VKDVVATNANEAMVTPIMGYGGVRVCQEVVFELVRLTGIWFQLP
jgi:hypothetical protein